jgi:hypothetical protein
VTVEFVGLSSGSHGGSNNGSIGCKLLPLLPVLLFG